MQTSDHTLSVNWLARGMLAMSMLLFPVWALAQSDLVMTVASFSPAIASTKGGATSITNTITNQGTTASIVNVRVGLYLSTDNVITTADTLLAWRTVGTLAAGGSNSVTLSGVSIPAGLAPGSTYYIGAIADDTGLEAESDESNNGLAGTTTLTITQPDLVITAVTSGTANIHTNGGAINNPAFTIKNQGAVASTVSVRVGVYLSTDNVITTGDILLGSNTASALSAGSSLTSGINATVPAGLAPGTYYLGVIADDTGLEAETNETNNGLAGTTTLTITQPDLVITAVSSGTTIINANGGAINTAFTIKNQGAVASTVSVRVGLYLSTDDVITTGDILLGSNTATALSAGSSRTTGINPTVPAGLALGTYYLGTIADDTGLEAESDETNNGLAGTTTLTITQPDLVMTAIGSTATAAAAGSYISVSDGIKNQGGIASTVQFRVGVYLSADDVITTNDTFLGYRTVNPLAAGASTTASSYSVTVPAGMANGTYYLGAIADYSGLEAESNEANNGLARTTTLTITQPDLVMTAISSTATAAAAGSYIFVSDGIKNQGGIASTVTFRVGVYLSADNVITTNDTFLGYRMVNPLAAGASTTASSYSVMVPAGMANGTYYLGAIADYTGLVAETDEANNGLAVQTIAIGPDLVMGAISTTSTTVIPGNAINVTDTLKNQGAAATGSGCRTIAYYLSSDVIITTTDNLIGSRQHCGTLAVNGTNTYTSPVTVPSGIAPGLYYLGAFADSSGVEIEAVETNNGLAATTPLLLASAPEAPTGVSATGGHTKATVIFTPPADDGGSPITGYTVTSSPLGGVDADAGTMSLNRRITGLVNGTAYTFTVKAANAIGNSPASQPSNSITPAPSAPDAPLDVSATGSHAQATVSFTAPPENGSPITGYTVTSNPGGKTASGTASPLTVQGLTNGISYTFTVTASNGAGASEASQPSNAVIPAPTAPDAPGGVSAAGGDGSARVSFEAPAENGSPISGYTVTSSPGGQTATGTASPIVVSGLTNGTAYTFTVTATNAIGTSPASQPSNSAMAMVLPTVYYVHTDHLDTPRMITDTQGSKVWEWQNTDPFGNSVPNENPSGLGQFIFDLRFPGQAFDKETGLHQNFFRDYDPATGRYIESDPIGLYGGSWSTYQYANSNPLSYVDPLGLNPLILGGGGATSGGLLGGGLLGGHRPNQSSSSITGNSDLDAALNGGNSSQSSTTTDSSGAKVSPAAQCMKAPGNCSPQEQKEMQDEVDQACREPRACSPGMDQITIQINISNGLRCALARNRINNKCFAGGDQNHRDEAIRVWNTVAKCQGMAN